MAKLGKRTRTLREATAGKDNMSVEDAVALIKGNATAKFDETVEISMNLGVDPRHADQMVRGVVGLPNGTGKTVRVAVFARGAKAEEAEAAGADIVGAEDLMETVQGGKIEFDRCIATPDICLVSIALMAPRCACLSMFWIVASIVFSMASRLEPFGCKR